MLSYLQSTVSSVSNLTFQQPQQLSIEDLEQITLVTDNYVGVSIKSKFDLPRVPVHLIVVLDISGSMNCLVLVKQEDGSSKSDGFTRLDLAKYALKISVQKLTDNDYLTVILFNDTTSIYIDGLQMTSYGKSRAQEQIDAISHSGSTNLWNATEYAFTIARNAIYSSRNAAIHLIFLTDGETYDHPNGCDERTEQTIEASWRAAITRKMIGLDYKCTLNTIGFTNDAKSNILIAMAKSGNGLNSFIPDGTYVITVIANMMANLLTTYAINCEAIITYTDGTSSRINLGSAKFGGHRAGLTNRPNVTTRMLPPPPQIGGKSSYTSNSLVSQNTSSPAMAYMSSSQQLAVSMSQLSLMQQSSRQPLQQLLTSNQTSNQSGQITRLPYAPLNLQVMNTKSSSKADILDVIVSFVNPLTLQKKFILPENKQIITIDDKGNSLGDIILFDYVVRQSFSEMVDKIVVANFEHERSRLLNEFINMVTNTMSRYSSLDSIRNNTFLSDVLKDVNGEGKLAINGNYFDT